MRKLLALTTLILLLVFSFILPTSNFASAASNQSLYTNKELKTIKNNLIDLGVTNDVANKLISKLENGILLDSMTMETNDPKVLEKTETIGSTVKTTYTFPDGSVAVQKNEDASTVTASSGTITPLSISGGSCSGGSGYTNCNNRLISYNLATYGFSFHANWTYVYGGYDQITWAGNWSIWTAGGTYSLPSMRIIKAKEDANGSAEARLSGVISIDGQTSFNRSLSLYLGNDKASDSWHSYY